MGEGMTVGRLIKIVVGRPRDYFIRFLLLGSLSLLGSNELFDIQAKERLNEVRLAAVEVSVDEVQQYTDQQLVHVRGTVRTSDVLDDPTFGLSIENAIHLQRRVEMYQWEERSQKELSQAGSTSRTTYSYRTVWSENLINSGNFNRSTAPGHNPRSMPFSGRNVSASNIELSSLKVDPSIMAQISDYQPLSLSPDMFNLPKEEHFFLLLGQHMTRLSIIPETHNILQKGWVTGNTIYIGRNPSSPQVGDVRIRFQIVPVGDVSIIAGLQENVLDSFWLEESESAYSLARIGLHSQESMLDGEADRLGIRVWTLRLVGGMIMFFGLIMFFKHLLVITGFIPFFRPFGRLGLFLFSGFLSIFLSLFSVVMVRMNIPIVITGVVFFVVLILLDMILYSELNKVAEEDPDKPV